MKQGLGTLAKQVFQYGLSGFLGRALSFFLLPIFTRILTPEDYGVIELVTWIAAMGSLLVTLGVDQGAARFIYEHDNEEGKRGVVSTAFVFQLIMVALAVCVLMFFGTLWPQSINSLIPISILSIVIIDFAFTVIQNYLFNLLRWNMEVNRFAALSVLRAFVLPFLSIIWVVLLRRGVWGYFISILIGDALVTLFCLWVTRRWLSLRIDKQALISMLRYGLPIIPYTLSFYAVQVLDRYLIQVYSSRADLGFFAIANKIAQILILLGVAHNRAWGPWALSAARDSGANQNYAKAIRATLWIYVGIICGVTLFSREILQIFTGPSFWGAHVAVFPLLFAALLYQMYLLLNLGSLIAKRTVNLLWTAILGALINAMAAWLLVQMFGFVGVAWALPLGYLPAVVGVYLTSQRVYYIPVGAGFLLTMLGISLAVGVGTYLLDNIQYPAGRYSLKLGATVIIGALMYALEGRHMLRAGQQLWREHIKLKLVGDQGE